MPQNPTKMAICGVNIYNEWSFVKILFLYGVILYIVQNVAWAGMSKKPYISPSFSYIPLEETLQIAPKKAAALSGCRFQKRLSFQRNR